MAFQLIIMDAFLLSNNGFELTPLSFNILGVVARDRVNEMASMAYSTVQQPP
jgi:hypothetical protein